MVSKYLEVHKLIFIDIIKEVFAVEDVKFWRN